MRLMPRSLLGQVMLALAVALLIAQGIAATLLYRAGEQRRETALMHDAAFQLLSGTRRDQDEDGPPPWLEKRPKHAAREARDDGAPHGPPPDAPRLPRRLRYTETAASPLMPGEVHDTAREAALRDMLDEQGIEVQNLVVTERSLMRDPLVAAALARQPELRHRLAGADRRLMVVGLKRVNEPEWQVARVPRMRPEPGLLSGLLMQTLILFAVLFGLLYLVLRRITRPLAALAESTSRFGGAGAPEPPLTPSGPEDVRRLIEAHNAMQARIGSMLDEKDVMLGAIGHDLKTPLAALRVRIESVEDDTARAKMAATIEDITRTLDEILALARVGRPDHAPEKTELHALAASVVEEFEDMGDPVTLADGERIAAPVRITWLKRGLRNLVANALRYAGSAEVSVIRDANEAVLRVDDNGRGIPADRIAAMMEPFARGEVSRNRETGGAGLGLALARAVAEQHRGSLTLTNRPEGGLRAEIRLPL